MSTFNRNIPQYKPTKDISFDWSTFKKGLNTFLQDTEIGKDELAKADNIVLVGQGVPTRRWGSALYYQAGNVTGLVRGLKGFYVSGATGANELLAITDDGYLTIRTNASYTRRTGASWASGNNAYMAQLDNRMYIVNGQRELVRYSSPTLVGFATIAVPVITGATNLSNASGTTTKSYRITAISQVGETLPSSPFELASQPLTLGGAAGGTLRLTWTGVSTASGILQGFNVYGRDSGNERFLTFAQASSTRFDDTGEAKPKDFSFPPTADSTGGPNTTVIARFQDRLVFGGLKDEPSKLLISGRVSNHEKFDVSYGGNFIKIEPDAGDDIIQIIGAYDRIIVFKEGSIWEVKLTSEQVGNFFVTTPELKLITASNGCIAPRSVRYVENDIFYLGRRGVYILGYSEGYFVDALRSNEISVKIRPYFKNLTTSQMKNAVAVYAKGKYLLAFPGKDEMMVFDRERTAWTGPWTLDATVFQTYYDSNEAEHILFAQDGSVNVDEFSESFTDDKGTAIATNLRTRSEDFGDWSIFKNIKSIFTEMRKVAGTVTVDIRVEQRNGQVVTVKTYSVTSSFNGNSGWGADMWGGAQWGASGSNPLGVEATYEIDWANLNKIGRTVQLIIRTSAAADNYELLGIKGEAKPLSKGFSPSSWRV